MPRLTAHFAHWPQGVPRSLTLPERTVFDNLAASAATFPQRIALTHCGRDWTYARLLAEAERIAGWLQAEGVRPGDRVMLYLLNSPQFVIGYYAILRAGAVVVPVNPMNRTAELAHLVEDTGAFLAIAGQDLLPHVAPLLGRGLRRVLVVSHAETADPGAPPPAPDLDPRLARGPGLTRWAHALASGHAAEPHAGTPDDIALLPYSSGTTGQPKGCVHTHRSVQATALGGVHWHPMDEQDVHLAALPLFHVTGMQNAMNGPLATGGRVVILTRWSTPEAAALIRRYRVTRFRSIATMMIDLVNDPGLPGYDLSSLKTLGGGGAAMPEEIARRLRDRTGLDYVEGYGMTEAMAGTHINPPHRAKRQCLGVPVFDVDARVLSLEDGRELGPDQPGEIVFHAPQNMREYWRNPQATAAAFVQIDGKRFLRSGDVGYHDAEGYFFMVDRTKRMVNAAGFKVWPAEVEMMMLRHPGIAEACVTGTPDPRRGEAVRAHVVPVPGTELTEAEVIAWCRREMAAYKCPTSVIFRTALPKSGAGKVLWRQLMEEDRAEAVRA